MEDISRCNRSNVTSLNVKCVNQSYSLCQTMDYLIDHVTPMGNSNVTDITFQRFLETLGAHFIYLQVLNLKSFTAITKQSSWIVHPMRLRSIFWISYEISYIMTAVTDITFFGSHILHTNTFVEKSVSLWISQRHFHYWCNDKIMYLGNSVRSETNGPKFQNHPIST